HLSIKTMASTRAEGDDFICSGPYRICRNPLYVGSLLQCFAFGLQLSWAVAVLFTLAHWIRYGSIVRYEESELRRSAPIPFGNYCDKVARWRPNLFSRDVWRGPFITWPAVAGNSLFVGLFVATVVCAALKMPQLFGFIEVAAAVPMIWYHASAKSIVS